MYTSLLENEITRNEKKSKLNVPDKFPKAMYMLHISAVIGRADRQKHRRVDVRQYCYVRFVNGSVGISVDKTR